MASIRRSKRIQGQPTPDYNEVDITSRKRKLSSESTCSKKQKLILRATNENISQIKNKMLMKEEVESDSDFEDVVDPIMDKMVQNFHDEPEHVSEDIKENVLFKSESDVMKLLMKCEGNVSSDNEDEWEYVDTKKVTSKKSKSKKRRRKSSEDFEDEVILAKSKSKKPKRNIKLATSPEEEETKRELTEQEKEMRRFTNRCTKDRTKSIEQSALVISIAYLHNLANISNSSFFQAMFLSHIPKTILDQDEPKEHLLQMLKWYRAVFSLDQSPVYKREKKRHRVLMMDFLSSNITPYEQIYVLGFLTCLNAVGLEGRLTASLYVPSLDKIRAASRVSPATRIKHLGDKKFITYKELVEDVSFWVELKNIEQIISIDVCNGVIDNDAFIENNCLQAPGYVVAMATPACIPLDCTPKYNHRWSYVHRKARLLHFEWWDWFMNLYLRTSSLAVLEHRQLMKRVMLDRGFPPSLGNFKHNLVYALEKDVLKMEAIYPRDAPVLGVFKSHNIYSRDNVKPLKQIIVIKKEGRDIRKGEVPYKVVKQKIFYDRWPGDDRWRDLPLWGEWQTEWYHAPTAADGKVPRNEFGNVELFKPWMLPKKTVHVDLPGTYALARRLGIDAAHAVVGFEFPRCRAVPMTSGVVVCEEHAETLRLAWEEYNNNQAKKQEEKRLKRIYDNWKLLIRTLLIKEKILTKYEGMSEDKPGAKKGKAKGHIHKFPKKSHRLDKITGQMVKKCACGLVVPIDDDEEEL